MSCVLEKFFEKMLQNNRAFKHFAGRSLDEKSFNLLEDEVTYAWLAGIK